MAARKPADLLVARPVPPAALLAFAAPDRSEPAPDVEAWLRRTFLEPGGSLHNPDHAHLLDARIGVLWTNVSNTRQGMFVAGTMEIPRPLQGNQWQKQRVYQQLEEWFGAVPDFLMTLSAAYCKEVSNIGFCALTDHELYHAAQARDEWGQPKFRKKDGLPVWAIKGHDVEEHFGVVRRYGLATPALQELGRLARLKPEVSAAEIDFACGVCLRR